MQPQSGYLQDHILAFSRLLRETGLPVGSGQVVDALQAVDLLGISTRDDFYHCLFPVFVNSKSQAGSFTTAFSRYFPADQTIRLADLLDSTPESLGNIERSLQLHEDADDEGAEGSTQENPETNNKPGHGDETEIEPLAQFSALERLRKLDFEAMSPVQKQMARRDLARLRLPAEQIHSRRYRAGTRSGAIELRGTLRASMRYPESIDLRFKQPQLRRTPLVLLCDISGSMQSYSSMLLHFMHALAGERDRVHAFVFGTRLSNISRYLRRGKGEAGIQQAIDHVQDWSGGTRLGACLQQFNQQWSRRTLAQGATVLLITDGLEREAIDQLAQAMERLAKSSRQLIWLNPLLRYAEFEPKAQGMQAMLPWVDQFVPAHNIASLQALTRLLAQQLGKTT
ncbi:MAG: VWA domain-containing protein [Gammaproteobacteria bacterium]